MKELEQSIDDLIDEPKRIKEPFVWTKSTEEILEKVHLARSTLASTTFA